MKMVMKRKLSLWKRGLFLGFIIGLIPFLLTIVVDFVCRENYWCKLILQNIFPIFNRTLIPFYFIFSPFILAGFDVAIFTLIVSLFMVYGYPIAYAIYGAIIGILIEILRRKRKKR